MKLFNVIMTMLFVSCAAMMGQTSAPQSQQRTFPMSGTVNSDYVAKAKPIPFLADVLKEAKRQCRVGVFNENGSGVLVSGDNGYAHTKVPKMMLLHLEGIKKDGHVIKDMILTNNGLWCVVWNKNSSYGLTMEGTPSSFGQRMDQIRANDETVLSIAYNDNHEWVILTDKGKYTSSERFTRFLNDAEKLYGPVTSVSITNTAMIACCQKGVYYDNIPKRVVEVLRQSKWIPRIVKFTDSGTCLITDGVSECEYWL